MKQQLYNVIYEKRKLVKNIGYDYNTNFLKSKVSNVLLKNTKVLGFIDRLEKMLILLANLPKKIKTQVFFVYKKDSIDLD